MARQGFAEGGGMAEIHHVGVNTSSDRTFHVADSLYASGDYFVAAIEYERVYYVSVNQMERVRANLGKVNALKQMNDFQKARRDIQRSLPHTTCPNLRFQVLYEWAFCAYMAGEYNESLLATRQLDFYFPERKHQDAAALLHALSLMQLERWDDLLTFLEHWTSIYLYAVDAAAEATPNIFSYTDDIQRLNSSLKVALEVGSRPTVKTPEKARLYATLMPGLGHLYAGEVGKGSLNMFSQALSLSTAGLLAFNGYYISTFTLGLGLFQSFYFGGIKQAGDLTSRRNARVMNTYKQQVGELLVGLDRKMEDVRDKSYTLASEAALEQALLALYDFNFTKADSISSQIKKVYPDQYLAHFSRTNYLWWLIITQPFSDESEKQYRESIMQSMELARNNSSLSYENQDLFYLISLYAMQARLDLKNGAYIRAMRNGRNAISHIERSRGEEEHFQGFLLTSGLYNYMTIQATRKYPFLKVYSLFYPEGDKELGLMQLDKAARSEHQVWKTEAHYFLMRLYLEMEENPGKALNYAIWLTDTYPGNLIFQYYHLEVLRNIGDGSAIRNKKQEIRSAALSNKTISHLQREYFLELIDN
jgi:hypothetical protein